MSNSFYILLQLSYYSKYDLNCENYIDVSMKSLYIYNHNFDMIL